MLINIEYVYILILKWIVTLSERLPFANMAFREFLLKASELSAANRAYYCKLMRLVVRFWENVKSVRHDLCLPGLKI